MDKVVRGFRLPGEDHIYQVSTDDPTIRQDGVTPGVEGYFRIPVIWVGERPDAAASATFATNVHHAVVVEEDLRAGIKARVLRDGTFLFDFSSWNLAPQIFIPGYRIEPGTPHRPPHETESAVQDSEKYAVIRAQVMNVHQSCLATAEWLHRRGSNGVGVPVATGDALKGWTFDECLGYRNIETNPRHLVRQAANGRDGVYSKSSYHRHLIDIEVAKYSLNLLDQILLSKSKKTVIIQMVEAAYLAACRCMEGRLGEAITLAWGVCEQLLSISWKELISEASVKGTMTRKRKEKLNNGRDYTASVVIEMLELSGRINHDLYVSISNARQARNNWMHKMQEPNNAQVLDALHAVEGLLQNVLDIQQVFPMHIPSPSVPTMHFGVWKARQQNWSTQR